MLNTTILLFGFVCLSYTAVPEWCKEILGESIIPDFDNVPYMLGWFWGLLIPAYLGVQILDFKCLFENPSRTFILNFVALIMAVAASNAFFTMALKQPPYGYIILLIEMLLNCIWRRTHKVYRIWNSDNNTNSNAVVFKTTFAKTFLKSPFRALSFFEKMRGFKLTKTGKSNILCYE